MKKSNLAAALTVLLIEDDAWLAEAEAASLGAAGYRVELATNALDAIDHIDAQLPQVIVADVLLAGSTIFALLHELQSYSDTGLIPVVLCTNIADQFEIQELTAYGVRRILDKTTMHPQDIAVAVRAVVA